MIWVINYPKNTEVHQLIGLTFRKIRMQKNISQKEVYTGIVSRSFFQKFEKGLHSISVEKFQELLNRINVSYDEFMYKHHGKLFTTDDFLVTIFNAYWNQDPHSLTNLHNKLRFSSNQTEVFLSRVALLFKLILSKESDGDLSFDFIFNYLDRISSWTFFETKLFNNIMSIVPSKKRNQYFKKAQFFFDNSKGLAAVNSEFANWYSHLYVNFIHLTLEEKELNRAKIAIEDMRISRQNLYTSERNELAYLFLKNLIRLYDKEERDQAIEALKKLTDLSQIVNKLNNETYSKLVTTHQEKTEPLHAKSEN